MATTRDFGREPPAQQQDIEKAGHALHSGRQHVNEYPQTSVTNHDSSTSALPDDETTVGTAATAQDSQEKGRDPNIVDWDGPDDPANPQNWYVAQ
jgi:hypothetical protein